MTAMDPLPRSQPEEVGICSCALARIRTVLEADIARERMPGAVLAIARRNRLVWFEAIGWRDKGASVRMTTDTMFNVASMTKPMTSVAALMLVEAGEISLDDPVAAYLPQLADRLVAVMNDAGSEIVTLMPAARPITIRDLMLHTSGMIYGGRGNTAVHRLYAGASTDLGLDGAAFLDKLASLPLRWQPGSTWDYGYGLDVLGLLIERVSGEGLGTFINRRICAPLGMTDTEFLIPPEQASRYAQALPNDPDTGMAQSVLPVATERQAMEAGGAGLVSTAEDYLRFALMLLNKGTLDGTRILARKTVQYMLTNQLDEVVTNLIAEADPTRVDYGFGLGLAVRTRTGGAQTFGSIGDFSWPGRSGTNWWADPVEDLAVVFMAHTPGPIRWHYRRKINAMVYGAIVD